MTADSTAAAPTADEPLEAAEDFVPMADLSPRVAGLPMIVRVSQRGGARHDACVRVSLEHGHRMRADRTCSVSVQQTVQIVAGAGLSGEDLALVRAWIGRSRRVSLDHWDGRIAADALLERLAKI